MKQEIGILYVVLRDDSPNYYQFDCETCEGCVSSLNFETTVDGIKDHLSRHGHDIIRSDDAKNLDK